MRAKASLQPQAVKTDPVKAQQPAGVPGVKTFVRIVDWITNEKFELINATDRINEIVRCRRGITAETALRLARYFGTDAQSWMNLQDRYELSVAERRVCDALAAIQPREVA